jgi:hypothetical protein
LNFVYGAGLKPAAIRIKDIDGRERSPSCYALEDDRGKPYEVCRGDPCGRPGQGQALPLQLRLNPSLSHLPLAALHDDGENRRLRKGERTVAGGKPQN